MLHLLQPSCPPLIENFNSLKPGQRGFGGWGGSGKSTLPNLAAKPWGEIHSTVNSMANSSPGARHNCLLSWSRISCCLLAASGKSDAWDTTIPDGNLVRACQDAALHDVVLSLPGAIVPTS